MPQPHYLSKFKTLIPYLPFIKLCLFKELCPFIKPMIILVIPYNFPK